jgi:UDP-N-acetylmuramoyl-tripeptide--D-alanyl-D-alanine ligase
MVHTSLDQIYSTFLSNPLVCTDSRNPIKDSIFFALSGPSFNGNAFTLQALEAGCKFAVIDDSDYCIDKRFFLVENTLQTLQDLARLHRQKMNIPVIGITGSNGKTTTKELVRNVLAKNFNTLATIGNLNNHIGVPLTLLRITKETEIAIIEMGASKQGDIKELAEIAEPNFGLITNIGLAHLEGMGGPEGVIKTKTELYDFLREKKGLIFLNSMHSIFIKKGSDISNFTFGNNESDDVCAEFEGSNPFVKFSWRKKNENAKHESIDTQLMGRYNFENILAALAIGVYFNVPDDAIQDAIRSYNPDNNRSQIIKTGKNTLIMDAYNANPTSLEAAILNFAEMQSENKILIIGKMMELGDTSEMEHARIGKLATSKSFKEVYLIGELYKKAEVNGASKLFGTTEEALSWFTENPIEHATILIKGSRANKMEMLQPLF